MLSLFQVCVDVCLWSEYATTTNFHEGNVFYCSGKNERGTVKLNPNVKHPLDGVI